MTSVREGLFLGDKRKSADRAWLSSKNIKLVINCTNDLPCVFIDCASSPATATTAAEPSIRYVRIPLVDVASTDLLSEIRSTSALAELAAAMEQSIPSLVHCQAGSSRSVSVLLVHLMSYEKLSLKAAKDVVSSQVPIKPNAGFMRQLIEIERELTGTVSLRVDELGRWVVPT